MKGDVHLWRGIAESLARALLATPSKGGICQLTDEQHAVLSTYYHAANIRGGHHVPKAKPRHPQFRIEPSVTIRDPRSADLVAFIAEHGNEGRPNEPG